MRLPFLQVTQETWPRSQMLAPLLGLNRREAFALLCDLFRWGIELTPPTVPPTGICPSRRAPEMMAGALEYPKPKRLVEGLKDIAAIIRLPGGGLRVRGMDRYAAAWLVMEKNRLRRAGLPINFKTLADWYALNPEISPPYPRTDPPDTPPRVPAKSPRISHRPKPRNQDSFSKVSDTCLERVGNVYASYADAEVKEEERRAAVAPPPSAKPEPSTPPPPPPASVSASEARPAPSANSRGKRQEEGEDEKDFAFFQQFRRDHGLRAETAPRRLAEWLASVRADPGLVALIWAYKAFLDAAVAGDFKTSSAKHAPFGLFMQSDVWGPRVRPLSELLEAGTCEGCSQHFEMGRRIGAGLCWRCYRDEELAAEAKQRREAQGNVIDLEAHR